MLRPNPVSCVNQVISSVCSPFVAAGNMLYTVVARVCNFVGGYLPAIPNPFSNKDMTSLQKQIVNLSNTNQGISQEYKNLGDQIQENEKTISLLRVQIEEQQERNISLGGQVKAAEKKHEQAEKELKDARENLSETLTKNSALTSEIKTAEEKVVQAEADSLKAFNAQSLAHDLLVESNKKLEELQIELKNSLVENKSLKENSGEEKSSLIAKIREQEETIKNLGQQLEEAQGKKTKVEEQLNEVNAELTRQKQTTQEADLLQQQLNAEISSLKKTIEEKSSELEKANENSSKSAEETGKLRNEMKTLKGNLFKKQGELALLEGSLTKEKSAVATLSKVLQAEQAKISRLEQEFKVKEERLQADLKSCKEMIVSKEEALKNLDLTIEETQAALGASSAEVTSLKAIIKANPSEKGENEALQQILREKEEEVSLLKNSLAQAKKSVVSLKEVLETERSKASQLEKEFEQKEAMFKEDLSKAKFEFNRTLVKLSLSPQAKQKMVEAQNGAAINSPSEEPPVPSSPAAVSPAVVLNPSLRMSPHAAPFTPPAIDQPRSPKAEQKEPVVDEPELVLPAPAVSVVVNAKDITPVRNAKAVKVNLIAWKQELLAMFDDEANLCCNYLALQKLQVLNRELEQLDVFLKEMEEYVKENPSAKQVPESMKKDLKAWQEKQQKLNSSWKKDLADIIKGMHQVGVPAMVDRLALFFNKDLEALSENPLAAEHLLELVEFKDNFDAIKNYFEIHTEIKDIPSGILNRIKLLRDSYLELKEKHEQVLAKLQSSVAMPVAGPSTITHPVESDDVEEVVEAAPVLTLNDLSTLYYSQKNFRAKQLEEAQALIEEMAALENVLRKSWQATGNLESEKSAALLAGIRSQKAKLKGLEKGLTAQIASKVNTSNREDLQGFTAKQKSLTEELKSLKEKQEIFRVMAERSQEFFADGAQARKAFWDTNLVLIRNLEHRYNVQVDRASEKTSDAVGQINYGKFLEAQREFLELKEKLKTFALDPKYAEAELNRFTDKLAALITEKVQRETELNSKKDQEEKNAPKSLLRSLGSLIWG